MSEDVSREARRDAQLAKLDAAAAAVARLPTGVGTAPTIPAAQPPPSDVRDEIAVGLLEANEGLGEAQCRIATAAGLPPSSSADEIVARVSALSAAAQPPPEVNHGPLPDGGFWAGFCSNPDCNVLGCPGDCDV